MEEHHPAGLQAGAVELQGFPGDEVQRHGAAGEGVQVEQVEAGRRLLLQVNPGVTGDHLHIGPAVGEEGEIFAGYHLHVRVELVEHPLGAFFRVGAGDAHAQAHRPHAAGREGF
jgi:hypothetical protein